MAKPELHSSPRAMAGNGPIGLENGDTTPRLAENPVPGCLDGRHLDRIDRIEDSRLIPIPFNWRSR